MTKQHDPQSVRDLAYRLWVERGRPEGGAEVDWFEAERQLLGNRRTDSQVADEAAKESFPASDPPASGLPDKPPVNAGEKWRAAEAAKPARKRRLKAGDVSLDTSPTPADEDPAPKRGGRETQKLGSRDAPGG